MEIFLLLVVILILLGVRSSLYKQHKQALYEIFKLKTELDDLKSKILNQQHTRPTDIFTQAVPTKAEDTETMPVVPTESIIEQVITQEIFPDNVPIKEPVEVTSFTPIVESTHKSTVSSTPPLMPLYEMAKEETSKPQSKPKPKISFFEKNPDLEKFIGENLVNKIGIAILVLGIGYFVKFAIDKDWINEIGRVAIGLLCGGILIGLAHRLRKEFAAFSSVLVGGGIAVLYFTISLAFHDYHLFSQTVAFSIMVAITAFAVVLAIAYNKIELAVLAIIGGFGSPFFVSTGQGNHIVLFSYLLILNGGMITLAYYKKWSLVNIVSYAFTILIVGGWLFTKYDNQRHEPLIVFGFASAFYLIFFLMNVVYNLKNKLPFKVLDLSLLLSNTFLFYSAGLFLLNSPSLIDVKGLFTVSMGVFNLGLAYPLYKRQHTDKNLIFMLVGLVLTFISLAAPIQLHGHYITLFWAAESALLLWLWQKSGIQLIKQTSVLMLALMLISLCMDWGKIYVQAPQFYLLPFANKVFVTGIFAVAAIGLTYRLLHHENESNFYRGFIPLQSYKTALQIILLLLFYLVLLFEISHQINYFYKQHAITKIVVTSYHLTYIAIVLVINRAQSNQLFKQFKIAILCIALLNIFLCNQSIIIVRNEILHTHVSWKIFFWLHLYIMAIGFYFIFSLHHCLCTMIPEKQSSRRLVYWISIILLMMISSMASDHLVIYSLCSKNHSIAYLLTQHHKFGYALLWGAIAFALINVGMRQKIREWRIISLTIFTLVIIKLFVYDISNISEAGRIVAFVLLGVLLLLVSFMYQRLKKLITTDGDNNENNAD